MNMSFSRSINIALCVLLIFLLSLNCFAVAVSSNEHKTIYVFGTYPNDDKTKLTGFVYSDRMLLEDANHLSTDIAKGSVALACAAYEQSYVTRYFKQMEFTVVGGNDSYSVNDNLSMLDNDHVAYTIGCKPIGEYIAYCIPIKGTSGNGEWFSNFNFGTSGKHAGFHIAAKEVQDELYAIMANDDYEDENTIVWLTGHSRGAAVANIIAGDLTTSGNYANSDHIFCYTFACPSVSKYTYKYDNIYNFNNKGDLIPALPLRDWGYDRYGHTITMNLYDDDNFIRRFSSETGESFCSESNTSKYISILTALVPNEKDYDDIGNQLLFNIAAWGLGGKNDANIVEVLGYFGFNKEINHIKDVINGTSNVAAAKNSINSAMSKYEEQLDFINEHSSAITNMDTEEFAAFLKNNSTMISKIEKTTEITIDTPETFLQTEVATNGLIQASQSLKEILDNVLLLFFDTDGHVLKSITHGHTMATYALWINSLLYGYKGWYGSPITETNLNQFDEYGACCTSVGESCFSFSSINTLVIPDTVTTLAPYCFNDCYSLREVTIPVDLVPDSTSFSGAASNVETIHYTKGRTGIMYDRISTSGTSDFRYESTVAYKARLSLKHIEFEEGITHIGDYAFLIGAVTEQGKSKLESVEFPSTLKSIGSHAFAYREEWSQELILPEGLNKIGSYCFKNCSSLTGLTLPNSLTEMGESCFYGCSNIPGTLIIHEGITILNEGCFNKCSSLTGLQLPSSLAEIHSYAFNECIGLTGDLVFPEGVTLIDSYAFAGCNSLQTIYFIGNAPAIDSNAFAKIWVTAYYDPTKNGWTEDFLAGKYLYWEPKNSTSTPFTIALNQTFAEIQFNGESYSHENVLDLYAEAVPAECMFPIEDLIWSSSNTDVIELSYSGDNATGYPKGTGVAKIKCMLAYDNSIYAECGVVVRVNNGMVMMMPLMLETINEQAFEETATQEFILPYGLRTINSKAFANSVDLRLVNMPDSISEIANDAFEGCTNVGFVCQSDNIAAAYAKTHGIPYVIEEGK